MNQECNCDGEPIPGIIMGKQPHQDGGFVVMRCDTCVAYADDTKAAEEVVRQRGGTWTDTAHQSFCLWTPPAVVES